MPRSDFDFITDLDFLRTHDLVRIDLPSGETAWLGSGRVSIYDPTESGYTATNVALASNGSTATASSNYAGHDPHPAAINGIRNTQLSGDGYGWASAGAIVGSEWLVVTFPSVKTISLINVITMADEAVYSTDPDLTTIGTLYNLVDFKVQYWDGVAWVDIADVTGNNKVWRQFEFSPITTDKIRVYATLNNGGYARVIELEAYESINKEFQPMIIETGDTRQSLTIASDKIPLVIQNVDRIFGLMVNDAETQLAGARCYFMKYFESLDGTEKEVKIVMRGEIANVVSSESEVRFTLVSDFSVGLAQIGGQQIGASCPLTFASHACGWTESQGGNPSFCNKQYFAAEGCSGHNNRHRFQGIIVGGDLDSPILGGGIETTGGGGGDDPLCFLAGTLVTLGEGTRVPIEIIYADKNYDYWVKAFNPDREFFSKRVLERFKSKVKYYYEIEFEGDDEVTKVAAHHPFYTKGNIWIRSNHLGIGHEVWNEYGELQKILSVTIIHEEVDVYNLHVEDLMTYIANRKLVHNRKNEEIQPF